MRRGIVFVLSFLLPTLVTLAAQTMPEEQARLEKQRCPKPGEFALVFSAGYAGNSLPTDDAKFEALLVKLKEGHFNTVHTTFTDKRLELCKKHGLKLMIDFLAPEHHVYKSPEKCQAIAEKLRGNLDVWGYNIWNDPIGKTGEGRRRDVNNVRQWDPTHPAYIGTYRTAGTRHLANADLLGYYDFHWERGRDSHFGHLQHFSRLARDNNAWFYSWLATTAGQPGKGNFNRSLYSANTSIACGQKGILWFLGGKLMSLDRLEWTEAGKDILKVQAEIAPLVQELAKIGNPSAIYSTPITRTMNNDPLPPEQKERMPPGLEQARIPAEFPIQAKAGEFVMGVFQPDAGKKVGALFLANHNAYMEQAVELLLRGVKLEQYVRKTRRWEPLPVAGDIARVSLTPGGGELLRFAE